MSSSESTKKKFKLVHYNSSTLIFCQSITFKHFLCKIVFGFMNTETKRHNYLRKVYMHIHIRGLYSGYDISEPALTKIPWAHTALGLFRVHIRFILVPRILVNRLGSERIHKLSSFWHHVCENYLPTNLLTAYKYLELAYTHLLPLPDNDR